MESLLPAQPGMMERDEDKDAKRKIQFSVPSSVPAQLDPLQVEMQQNVSETSGDQKSTKINNCWVAKIRRRRPTPATLFRTTDPPSPEEEKSPHQWLLGETGAVKLVPTSTYQPPSLKEGVHVCMCVNLCVLCGMMTRRGRCLSWIILDYRMRASNRA
uniref:Protein phosphatase 1 regulatory subunit 1B n=1 Tax=Cynoglossus semilaevis TaxID=244447 RepID=A0A3P8V997_CYNSE